MYMFIESLRIAVHALRANVLRSILTMLGMIIGVAAVISVVALMESLRNSVTQQFQGFGANTVQVEAYTSFKETLQGRFASLSHSDLMALSERLKGIDEITPFYVVSGDAGEIKFGSKASFTSIYATSKNYSTLYQAYISEGRFLEDFDNARRRPVAVLGHSVINNLEMTTSPVGDFIQLGEHWFKVIGVMEEKGDLLGIDQDDFIIIPYETGRKFIGDMQSPEFTISFSVSEGEDLNSVVTRAERILRQSRGLKEGQENDFKIKTASQITESFDSISSGITAVLVGVVAISLLVGGIGIMNIMLVSVTERTKEIGVSRALGAKRGDILFQFMLEALILALLGGVIGILLGLGVAHLIALLLKVSSVTIPLWTYIMAFSFSASVGLVFGILPAIKAANLNTIDALRFE